MGDGSRPRKAEEVLLGSDGSLGTPYGPHPGRGVGKRQKAEPPWAPSPCHSEFLGGQMVGGGAWRSGCQDSCAAHGLGGLSTH